MLELDWFWNYVRSELLTNAASSCIRLHLVTRNIISFNNFPQHEFLYLVILLNPIIARKEYLKECPC